MGLGHGIWKILIPDPGSRTMKVTTFPSPLPHSITHPIFSDYPHKWYIDNMNVLVTVLYAPT
jgi:hypothetical protein